MQVSLLYLTEKIGQGTKTLITSDENLDGKNDKRKSELELTTESTAKTYRLYVLFIG